MKVADITASIVSASATIIAIVALGTGVYQAKLSRDQARASVWPYLIQGNSNNNGYAYIVQNVGLGPAVIRAFEVRVDGKPARTWREVADLMGITLSWKGKRSTTFRAGLVLPANAPLVELLELPDSGDAKLFKAHTEQIRARICFCSLYGDCWENRNDGYESEKVKACKDDEATRFIE